MEHQKLGADLIIFDVDDVLIENAAVFRKNTITAATTVRLDVDVLEEYFEGIHAGTQTPISPVKRLCEFLWSNAPASKHSAFVRIYQMHSRATQYHEVPCARAMLLQLQMNKVPMAICSNAHYEGLAARFSGARIPHSLFTHVAHPQNGFAKPDARAFDGIFASHPARRERTIFVGDMITDFETAQNAGTQFVGVLTGLTSRETFIRAGVNKTHIIHSVADLPKLLT